MSITRQTIKRLENEMEKINPDKTRLFTCFQRGGIFYYNDKPYQTLKELKESEGINDSQTLITIVKFIDGKETKNNDNETNN